jgi:hypothetical protein
MTTRTRKGKADVAWGYFYTNAGGERRFVAYESDGLARACRKHDADEDHLPGPIFRITEPAKPRSRKP